MAEKKGGINVEEFLVIKNNLTALTDFEQTKNNILLAQIEETVCLIDKNSVDACEAAEIFKSVFSLPLLSETFMSFCDCLSSNNCFKSSNQSFSENKLKSVCMMDNLYSKDAYQQFSAYDLLNADYENTFTSVCEAVYSNRCQYAILPLFNSRDGLMVSIFKLLQKYELKIVASTKVLVSNGDTETEFMLVTSSENDQQNAKRIMLSLTHSYDNTISNLLSAFKVVGAVPISINTLPLEYTDERCESIIILDISLCNIDTICSFIQASLHEVSILGIYSLVK